MTQQMTSYLQLLVAIFAASSYGLVAKKFQYSSLVITYFFALTFTIIPLTYLLANNYGFSEIVKNIFEFPYMLLSCALFIFEYSITAAHQILPMAIAGPIVGTVPIFFSTWEYILNGRTINLMQLFGYFVAIMGIVLINYRGISRDYKKANKMFYVGVLFAITYCIGTSFYIVYNDTLQNTLESDIDFICQRLFGSGIYVLVLMSIAFTVFAFSSPTKASNTEIPDLKNALLLMASISITCVASTFLFVLSKPEINPVTYSSLLNLRSIFMVLLGILVMKEKPNIYIVIGLAVVILGILFSIFSDSYSENF
jgi:drug/metabolite transporter (DMT)-like permease